MDAKHAMQMLTFLVSVTPKEELLDKAIKGLTDYREEIKTNPKASISLLEISMLMIKFKNPENDMAKAMKEIDKVDSLFEISEQFDAMEKDLKTP